MSGISILDIRPANMLPTTRQERNRIIVRDRQERRPDPRNDVVSHYIEESGESPNRKFTVVFEMADGSFQSFDGKNWT